MMSMEKIETAIDNIMNRTEAVRGRGEEATKQAMILPMIEALGYDIWNPLEVCPEFEADTAIKKNGQKEKVDFAILFGGEPKIYIEAKPLGEDLDGHHGQLKRYFCATPSVSLGILTNGSQYRFFTDTGEINIQDDKPFFISDFDAVDRGTDVIARFQKGIFSGEAIREFATELTYTAKMVQFLKSELDVRDGELTEGFVRWVLAAPSMYEGRVTANVVERFKPIAKDALQKVVRTIVRRSVAAIDEGVSSPSNEVITQADAAELEQEDVIEASDEASPRKGIVTTEEELEAFAIIKKQFDNSALANQTIYDPASRKDVPIEIGYKDTTAYFNIYFNKPSWWNLRLSLDSKIKWVGIDVDPIVGAELTPSNFEILKPQAMAQFRVKINTIEDLNALNQAFHASFEKTIQDRESIRGEQA
jgi:predicted type IV restriction endonuclease